MTAPEETAPVVEDVPATETGTAPAPTETQSVQTPAPTPVESAAPQVTVEPTAVVSTPAPEPTTEQTPAPAETPAPAAEEPSADATAENARAYIGQSASSLIDALGAPISSSYAPSCLGPGEDGELIYDGFTVYTYREDGVETVEDVL